MPSMANLRHSMSTCCCCTAFMWWRSPPLCSDCFSVMKYRETYSQPIYPIPDRSLWNSSSSGLQGVLNKADMMLSPPNIRRPPGRPKMKILKIESLKRPKRIVQCGWCHLLGHSQKKCSLPSWYLSIDVHWTLFWQNREVHACLCLSIFLCCAVSPTSSLLQILLSYLPVGARRSK